MPLKVTAARFEVPTIGANKNMAKECSKNHGDRLSWKPPHCFSVLLMLCFTFGSGEASCSLLNKNGSSTTMQFTSLDTVKQHVTKQGYQAISCEVVNFCHVRWYRRRHLTGQREPYPWDLGKFTVFFLEDDNQTLIFKSADETAKGFYECEVSNSTHNITRRTQLTVDKRFWIGEPLQLQHQLCHNHTAVAAGENVTLLCKFYVGALRDFTTVYWQRPNMSLPMEQWSSCGNGSDWLLVNQLHEISHDTTYRWTPIRMDDNSSDAVPWVGSKLEIINVSEEAYGIYCVIANNGGHWSRDILMLSPPEEPPQPDNYHALAVAIFVSSFIFVAVLFLTWKMVALDVKLWYQGHYGNTEQNDGKMYDAYVSYSWSDNDRQFILRVIMPYLEKYGYRLFVPEIHTVPSNVLLEELNRAMEASRRCIMLITPSYTISEFGKYEVELAADIMSSRLSERIIPVFLGVSPFSDPSPLSGSEPSLSSASSCSSSTLPSSPSTSSQPSSLSSDSGNHSTSETSPDSLSSCSSASSKPVKIDFNISPLLGQLIKVLKPLKTSRKEPHMLRNHTRFLKRLRLRMPRPPAGNGVVIPRQEVIMETMSQTSDLVDNEVLPDGREEGMDFRMQTFPRLYPVVPDGDTQNEDMAGGVYPVELNADPTSDTSMSWNP
ncbi:uncharacterized protein LOC119723743 isoform X2 [Patiria miniata]|uniref:Soluble interferon alpha/beta receptor OPG204 n=1 Tax=Patiria miniata TaxID=46514 RepID=A0A913ZGE9_PATMI|nr:uncharacterized protein LOC119723743 isoform X2 [Patiria miniata]